MRNNSKELLNHVDSSNFVDGVQSPVKPSVDSGNFTFTTPYFDASWTFLHKIKDKFIQTNLLFFL